MWAVASSFNYLLFFDFVFKDWVTAFLHVILERFISKSISFAFRFSCHFRYASNFGSFPRFSSRASHFKKTLFTSAINPSVFSLLIIPFSFIAHFRGYLLESRFFYRCQPMVSNHSSNVIFNMFLTRKNSASF